MSKTKKLATLCVVVLSFVLLVVTLIGCRSVVPSPAPGPSPVPGRSHFDDARVYYDDVLVLKAGETKLLDVTLETRKDGPGKFNGIVSRVAKEYGEAKLPMPEGLEVSIEPSEFMAFPDTIYHSTITVKTTSKLALGEYYLLFERNFENAFHGMGWIRVAVES